jgi:8-hydroxy-5-deazaflavin:NADPH oxidoreductase
MSKSVAKIAVIGGTGDLGGALARRWARAGRDVIIGSRDAARAATAAATLGAELGCTIPGMSNRDAARTADIVVVTVPFAVQRDILNDIRSAVQGKLVVDATVPLVPPKVMRVQLPAEGSAAVIAQQLLGEAVTVVSAFHSVSAHRLATDDTIDCDVLVFGDKKDARALVIELASAAGLRGLHAGALVNSAAAEALTSVLIFMNKTYAVDGAGIRITGALREPDAS